MKIIPITSDFDRWRQEVALSGTRYIMRFYWLPRNSSWYMHLLDEQEETIATGRRVRLEWPMFWRDKDPRLFDGDLLFLRNGDSKRRIKKDELGDTVFLHYFEPGELDPEQTDPVKRVVIHDS